MDTEAVLSDRAVLSEDLPPALPVKRWRFLVADIDGNEAWLDANGGPDGDEGAAEFIGTSKQACDEGDRRSDLWEQRLGRMAHKISRCSMGRVEPVAGPITKSEPK